MGTAADADPYPRMAHELSAAGHGYVWPRMLFAADGENMHIWAAQPKPDTAAAVRYLTSAYGLIPGSDFENTIDTFIASVLARLEAVDIRNTTLQDLWQEILEERADRTLATLRRFEAILGFDPDECPEDLLARLNSLIPEAGPGSVTEITSACASSDPVATLDSIISFAHSKGLEGRIGLPLPPVSAIDPSVPVWQRGRLLASEARTALGLNGGPVDDRLLCDLVGLTPKHALHDMTSRPPIGMAIRNDGKSDVKFLLRKRHRPGRRFELARFLCDASIAGVGDRWLPATDAKTARQKTQRAFAAEFLCPIHALTDYLNNDFSTDAIEDAAEHFGVGTLAVETQLVNGHLLPRDVLNEYSGGLEFPYP